MGTQELLNIITICISTILSIGAIILSLWFYKESNKQNKETSLMQTDIKNAIVKLEQLHDRTYTDTFGALKTQFSAMQNHIFPSTVGEINNSEPDKLRFYILGFITQNTFITIDQLCQAITGYEKTKIKETIYSFHQEGIINFDGNKIKYVNKFNKQQKLEGQDKL